MAETTYAATSHHVPWRDQWGTDEPRSPRKRWPQSPRRRKGSQKGAKGAPEGPEAKGKAKGKGQGEDASKKPPSLEALPAGPSVPAISQPKQAAAAEAAPSQDKMQLESLLGILAASSSSLPPAAQQLIANIQESTVTSTTKAKHKAVTEQAKARQALAKVQSQRAAYLQAWQQYVNQLATLLETQVQEQTSVLEEFDQAELMWTQAEHSATQQLTKLTSTDRDSAEPADKDFEDAEEAVDMTIETEQKLRAASEASQHNAKRMLAALTDLQQSAEEQVQKAGRDGSRTPRRQTDAPGTKEDAKAVDGGAADAKAKAGGNATRPFGLPPPGGAHA